jgi:predicted MPP superfamily phosphohydrolase
MKRREVLLFFSVVFGVYGLLNFYIFLKGWQILDGSVMRIAYLLLFLLLSLSFVAGRMLERQRISTVSTFLVWTGSFWLAAMVYFVMVVVMIDCIRLLDHFVPVVPDQIPGDLLAGSTIGLVLTIVAAGHVNALLPRTKVLTLAIPKTGGSLRELNIAVASDIHLGTIVCRQRLERIIDRINSLNPDLVLLPGDVVDEDIEPVIRQNLGETLKKIRSKHGVFAVTGNHEYIGGVEEACRYLEDHGIVMLRDASVTIASSINVVGREDRAIRQFAGRKRKSLEELMATVDTAMPVILMDHQPAMLDEAERYGVDLQLSGHTHHGQLWPFNYITSRVFEVSWGYKKKSSTHVYVSSGVGTWGPPVRTGNRPEIVNIRLSFLSPGPKRQRT